MKIFLTTSVLLMALLASGKLSAQGVDLKCDQPCDTGKPGICGTGVFDCSGETSFCRLLISPGEKNEICNGEDDDCDDVTDEGFDKDSDGYTTCSGDCNDNDSTVHPDIVESCDGVDNNCNGLRDEGFKVGKNCKIGVGGCIGTGKRKCAKDGFSSVCEAVAVRPSREICDGVDNDCDGEVDEGLPEISCGVGACLVTVSSCVDGKPNECVPAKPAEELCGDSIDNDCDGKKDEDFKKLHKKCTVEKGACLWKSKYECSDDKLSLVCPVPESALETDACGKDKKEVDTKTE